MQIYIAKRGAFTTPLKRGVLCAFFYRGKKREAQKEALLSSGARIERMKI